MDDLKDWSSIWESIIGVVDIPEPAISGSGITKKTADGTGQPIAQRTSQAHFITPHYVAKTIPQSDKATASDKHRSERPAPKKSRTQNKRYRNRLNNDAKAMMSGLWDQVQGPYRPRCIEDEDSMEWRTEVKRQKKIDGWMLDAMKPSKTPGRVEAARYRTIMKMRKDPYFASIADKVPEPNKPASMIKSRKNTSEPQLPAQVHHTVSPPILSSMAVTFDTLKRKQSRGIPMCKQKIIDSDPDSEKSTRDSEKFYLEPVEEAVVQREGRAKECQQLGTVAPQPTPSFDQEELDLQVEEVRLKAQLEEVQLRREMLSLRRRNDQAN